MSEGKSCQIKNGKHIALAKVPCLDFQDFRQHLLDVVHEGGRVCSLFGMEPAGAVSEKAGPRRLFVVTAHDAHKSLGIFSTTVEGRYPALTPDCPQVHLFERELHEECGLVPEGHPWLKPVRRHSAAGSPKPNEEFFQIEGEEIHEVAVGPVHAGVIEPGHFRFQCHGEKVFHLEISLGYQHRGIEKTWHGGPHRRTLFQMETLAGDTTIGHTLAYCQALEGLAGCEVAPRAQAIRAIGLELERLANHTGDLGALGGDVGYLPTASYCGRIRGDFLNLTALICGNRLGRGLVRPGGVGFDIDTPERLEKLMNGLKTCGRDVQVAVDLLWETPAIMARFENTGVVSHKDAMALGMVGPAARASGVHLDVRRDFPLGQYRGIKVPVFLDPVCKAGDVAARAHVRWSEISDSLRFLNDLSGKLPQGGIIAPGARLLHQPLAPDSLVVSLVEGWRGEICHTAVTDHHGKFARYKVVDPSFHNWIGLAMALRNQAISDFPLCNKSFNLSYCGFDL